MQHAYSKGNSRQEHMTMSFIDKTSFYTHPCWPTADAEARVVISVLKAQVCMLTGTCVHISDPLDDLGLTWPNSRISLFFSHISITNAVFSMCSIFIFHYIIVSKVLWRSLKQHARGMLMYKGQFRNVPAHYLIKPFHV